MAAGFKVWNNDGSVKFDLTTRLTRLVGSIGTGTQDSFIDVPTQGNNVFFFAVTTDPSRPTRGMPNVTITVLSPAVSRLGWNFTDNTRTSCTLYYGLW